MITMTSSQFVVTFILFCSAQFGIGAYIETLDTNANMFQHVEEGINTATETRQANRLCLSEHNAARRQNGKSALVYDRKLEAAAKNHNDVMVSKNCFSHQCSGEKSLGDRVTNAGYTWSTVGENIAANQRDCKSVMEAWMKSDGHRNNILGNFKNVACVVRECSNCTYKTYWTCVFGTSQ